MSDSVTSQHTVVCGSAQSYATRVANLASYEANPANPPVTNKVLDEANRTITYTVTTVVG